MALTRERLQVDVNEVELSMVERRLSTHAAFVMSRIPSLTQYVFELAIVKSTTLHYGLRDTSASSPAASRFVLQ
jgi:hypothetical protein